MLEAQALAATTQHGPESTDIIELILCLTAGPYACKLSLAQAARPAAHRRALQGLTTAAQAAGDKRQLRTVYLALSARAAADSGLCWRMLPQIRDSFSLCAAAAVQRVGRCAPRLPKGSMLEHFRLFITLCTVYSPAWCKV